nr:hypothetical protein [Tanacetum cinerariifolium]
MSLLNPQRYVVPIAVLPQSKLVPINDVRPVYTAVPKICVTRPRQAKTVVTKTNSPPRRHINRIPSSKASNFPPKVTIVKAPMVNAAKDIQGKWEWKLKCLILDHGNPQHALKDKGGIDSGCSRHMTWNMSYLTDFEELNGGYVAFGGNSKGGKISGKVLLRVPSENNMYNVNLKHIVPSGDLTCLFVKAALDESNHWHRRLGHINFKSMNKLVKGNLVRGLPSKVFENDNTCVACKKGKQHRASCMTKPVSSVNQPLYRLHMDLFGPTFVKSLNKKSYCLVITDDYSWFTWVFFLATKDETSPILKSFITGLENQLSLKVKVIRSNNGTEFKNNDLNKFCGMKRIEREFSVPRTLSKMALLKGKTKPSLRLLELCWQIHFYPFHFWAEAVNTACYVQNRVLVTKPQNKTLYELLHGRTPSIGFIRPFGCPVTIFNTLDSLGKFDWKVDEGFLVGYSISSRSFRVFNSRTRIVQETFHVNFLENKPNVAGSDPTWLFNIDTLTKTMNYQPVTAGNQSNPSAGVQENFDNTDGDASFNEKEPEFERRKPESEVNVSLSSSAQSKKHDDKTKREANDKSLVESLTGYRNLSAEFDDFSDNIINEDNATGTLVPAVGELSPNSTNTFSAAGPSKAAASPTNGKCSCMDTSQILDDPNIPELEDITYFDDEDDVGAEDDFNNLETSITVSPIPTTRVHKDHYVTQIIGNLSSTTQTRSMTRVARDQGGLSQINNDDFHTCMFSCFLSQEEPKRVHQALKDPSWIEAMPEELLQFKMQKVWVLVDLPHGKRAIGTKWVFRNKKDERGIVFKNKARLKKDGIFISQDKYIAEILRKFRLTGGKSASTPIDTKKPLLKDLDDQTVSGKDSSNPLMADNLPKIVWYSTHHVALMKSWLVQKKTTFGKTAIGKEISNPFLVNDVTRLQALVDKKKVIITEATIREGLCLDDAEGIECLPNEEIFTESARMGYEKPSTKLTFYKAFFSSQWKFLIHTILQCDLSSHSTKYTSPALTQKVFANMRRVGKGFSKVDTPLFEDMLVAQEDGEDADEVHAEDVNAAGVVAEGVASDDVNAAIDEPSIPSPKPPTPPPQLSQDIPSTS